MILDPKGYLRPRGYLILPVTLLAPRSKPFMSNCADNSTRREWILNCDRHHGRSFAFHPSQAIFFVPLAQISQAHIYLLTSLEARYHSRNEIRTYSSRNLRPATHKRILSQHNLHPPIHSSNVNSMTSTITRSPKSYFLSIYIVSRLGVSNGILCISSLNCRDDFMSWLAGCGIAGAETAVVVDEAERGRWVEKWEAKMSRSHSLRQEKPWERTRQG
jgi:hypothetical protein